MGSKQFCIYAVDDDDDDRLLIETALRSYSDCEVTFFEDGEKLLIEFDTTLEENLPTLILLDIDMPHFDGYETLHEIRANPKLRSIPVLMLSGTYDKQTVHKAYGLGANTFMRKPDTYLELDALLKLTYEYWLKTAYTPQNS